MSSEINTDNSSTFKFINDEIKKMKNDHERSLNYSIPPMQAKLKEKLAGINRYQTGMQQHILIESVDDHAKELNSKLLRYARDLQEKIINFCEEILPPLTDETISTLKGFFSNAFNEKIYISRQETYIKSLPRIANQNGIQGTLEFNDSLNHRGTESIAIINLYFANLYERAFSEFKSKLEHLKLKQTQIQLTKSENYMSIGSLLTDTIQILKKQTGEKIDGIKASVQKDKIFIQGVKPLIETGDFVNRTMSNGAEETYEVIDPGFHEQFHGIPAGYQMDVKKLGMPEAKAALQSVTYNLYGNNSRVNQSSTDNSINTVNFISPELNDLIESIRQEITNVIENHADKVSALEVIDVVEAQITTSSPKKSIIAPLLNSLPHLGNIANLAGGILAIINNS